MANIYYKNRNNQYKKFSYLDIGAAAASHTHDISEIWGWNFKDNGCIGQNILKNFDEMHNNLLFYVPHTHSDIIYTKAIPNSVIDNPTVLYYNDNKNIQQIVVGEDININLDRTTAYAYNGIGSILTNLEYDFNTYKYYYYIYPLNISYIDENDIDNIILSFQTNLDDKIWTINFIKNDENQNFEINSCNYTYVIESPIINENYYVGLIQDNIQNISGISIIKREKKNIVEETDIIDKQQIEITNIIINTDVEILISQNYLEYYDYSIIPPITTGSLGPIDNSKYSGTGNVYDQTSINDVIRYYRSYKFHNLLTWGQSIALTIPVISGYCDSKAWNRGFFGLHIPYEFDEDITSSNINLEGIASVWTLGRYAGTGSANYDNPSASDATCGYYKNLVKGTTVKSGQFSYNIYRLLPGSIWFQIYFPAANTEKISFYCPLQMHLHTNLTISISNKT